MGLLDSLTYDPQMALGMGLLAAGGNSRMPVSIGQGLASGWGQMQDTAKEKQKRDLLAQQAEMQKMQMQEVLRKGQESAMRQQQMQSMDVPPEVKAGLVPFDEWWKLQNKPPEFKAFGGGIFNTAKVGPDGAPSKVGDVPLENKPTELDKLMDRAGITDPAQRAEFASKALAKQTTHPPAISVQPKIEIKTGEGVASQVGPMMKDARIQAGGAVKMFDAANRIETAINSGMVSAGPLATPIMKVKQLFGGSDDNVRQTRQVIKSLAQMSVEARKQLQGQGQVTESEAAAVAKADAGDIDDLTVGELKDLVTLTKRASHFTAVGYNEQLTNLSSMESTKGLTPFYKVNGLDPLIKHNPKLPEIGGGGIRSKADAIIGKR